MNEQAVRLALPGPFNATAPAQALQPQPATVALVRSQVQALLTESPSYSQLSSGERRRLFLDLVKISAYAAELVRDAWWQAGRLGQQPLVRDQRQIDVPVLVAKPQNVRGTPVRSQAVDEEFRPVAANQVARITQETLKAIAFPTFVADLIRGTFNAIVEASIRQMEAYGALLANVAKTVDQFMSDNISDNQARDWLQERYPGHIRVHQGQTRVADGAEDRTPPNFRSDLNLSEDANLDNETIEEVLVPAARRRLAESRLQLLSTLVLMGVNRVIVTAGRIHATMGFHIDTSDTAHVEQATDLDFSTSASGSLGFGPWSASASVSFSYVRSTRAESDASLNVNADLTGEVDISFRSDVFPLQRFVDSPGIDRIRANTAVPEANTAGESSPAIASVQAADWKVPV